MDRLLLGTGVVDLVHCTLQRHDGGTVQLTSLERDLLAFLASHPSTDLSRETLLSEVWGYAATARTRALDTAVKQLRRKIEVDRKQPQHLLTVWGHGYRFEPLTQAVREPLIGRSTELAALEQRLGGPRPRIVLTGPGGVGKSRLVREATRASGCVLVDLHDLHSADHVSAAVARALPDSDLPLEARLARLALPLVLDDAEHLADVLPGLLDPWLAAAPDLALVVTSRVSVSFHDSETREIRPLEAGAFRSLLGRLLGKHGSDEPTPLIDPLAERLDGLPLAAELVSSWRSVLGTGELLQRLDELLDRPSPEGSSLVEVVRRSIDLLPEAAQETLRACACFAGPFSAADVESMIDTPDPLEQLDTLRRASLLSPSQGGPGTPPLRVLPLVRRVIRVLLPGSTALRRRFARLVVARADRTTRWIPELDAVFRDETLDADLRILAGEALFLATRRRREGFIGSAFAAQLARLADAATDDETRARALFVACGTELRQGPIDAHLLERATRVAARSGSALARLRIASMSGTNERLHGDVDEALACFTRAVAIGAGMPPSEDLAIAHAERALVQRARGWSEGALASLQTAQELADALDMPWLRVLSLHRRGHTLLGLGRTRAARLWLSQALDGARAAGLEAQAHHLAVNLALADLEAAPQTSSPTLENDPLPGTEAPFHTYFRRASLALLKVEQEDLQAAATVCSTALSGLDEPEGVIRSVVLLSDGVWRAYAEDPGARTAFQEVAAFGYAELATFARGWLAALDADLLPPAPDEAPSRFERTFLNVLATRGRGPAPTEGLHARLLHRWFATPR